MTINAKLDIISLYQLRKVNRWVRAKLMNGYYIKRVGWMMCLMLLIGVGCADLPVRTVKTYHSDYRAAVQASSEALQNLEFRILKEESDELNTKLLARRPNGTPVTVEVKRIDQNFTQVAVATGAGVYRLLGSNVSDQIHGFIRKQLMISPSSIKWPEE